MTHPERRGGAIPAEGLAPVGVTGDVSGPVLTVIAYGTPAPQGSHKAFVVRGAAVITHDSLRTRPWRNTVTLAARDEIGDRWAPLDGPVGVRFVFTVPKPASAPKRRRTHPCRKPDWDKLARCASDALTDAGVYTDDARIVEAQVIKCYPDEHPESLNVPGARLSIWSITGRQ